MDSHIIHADMDILRRKLEGPRAALAGVIAVIALYGFIAGIIWAVLRNEPPVQPRAQLGPRSVEIVRAQQPPVAAEPQSDIDLALPKNVSAEEAVTFQFRRFTSDEAVVRIERRHFSSADVFVSKHDWEDIPYPDRPTFLGILARNWCDRVQRTFLTRLEIRDIRSGDELASCSCP